MRLTKDRRRELVDVAARIMRQGVEDGQPSLFAFEGFLRHGIRSSLCLRRWSWAAADAAAADILSRAFAQTGAARPSWSEGQRENEWSERTRCVTCGWRLPEERKFFCSAGCYKVKEAERRSRWDNAYDKAVRYAAWWKSNRAADS